MNNIITISLKNFITNENIENVKKLPYRAHQSETRPLLK
jgi:hypothetical protein